MPSFLFDNGTFYTPASISPQRVTPADFGIVAMTYPSLYLTPAAPLTAFFVKLPARPVRGMVATIVSTQTIDTFTVTTAANAAITGSPSTLTANTKVTMQYISNPAGTATWVWIK